MARTEQDAENLAGRIFNLYTGLEDIDYTFSQSKAKNEHVITMKGLLQSIATKLDLSNAKETQDEGILDVWARRVGEAFGTYVKLLGMANNNQDAHSDIKNMHDELEALGAEFKQVVADAADLAKDD